MRITFDEVTSNKTKSIFLMALFIVMIGLLGGLVGVIYGNLAIGLIISLSIAGIYALIAYYAGGKMLLAMSGAKEVTKQEYPHLFHAIEGLSIAAGIPKPKAYVIDDPSMNAFATGRDPEHAAVAVTSGLLKRLNRQELEGVIAHELAHIKHYDVRLMMISAIMVGVITILSDFILRTFLWGIHGRRGQQNGATVAIIVIGLLFAILTPLVAYLIKLAISRRREYAADAGAITMTRYPQGLADALRKISGDPDPALRGATSATAHMYISNPFRKSKGWFKNLFSTHPPIKERIKRLEQM